MFINPLFLTCKANLTGILQEKAFIYFTKGGAK